MKRKEIINQSLLIVKKCYKMHLISNYFIKPRDEMKSNSEHWIAQHGILTHIRFAQLYLVFLILCVMVQCGSKYKNQPINYFFLTGLKF